MKTNLVWITPDAEALIAYIARVSNPKNQDNPEFAGLLRYCLKHKHWSIFEMASACFEINTTRDIGRQILRHRSFVFQELSQRYTSVDVLPEAEFRECRLQDHSNRQNSLGIPGDSLQHAFWTNDQQEVYDLAIKTYRNALERGVAKEVARALLPEGLTPSRMYMSGTIRSWMHYCQLRCGPETQKEHREIATEISNALGELLPNVWGALEPMKRD
jgi:thymidylate synthase (FAD)